MCAQKSSSASEPIDVKATTIRHRPPKKHARRQPGTARDVRAVRIDPDALIASGTDIVIVEDDDARSAA